MGVPVIGAGDVAGKASIWEIALLLCESCEE